jgi:hypothetical protein
MTHDTEFEEWANKVWSLGSGLGEEVSLKDCRKDNVIEINNESVLLLLVCFLACPGTRRGRGRWDRGVYIHRLFLNWLLL